MCDLLEDDTFTLHGGSLFVAESNVLYNMLQFKTVPWDSALSLVLLYLALLAPAASSAREVQAPGIAKRGLSQDALLGNANISGTSNRTVYVPISPCTETPSINSHNRRR